MIPVMCRASARDLGVVSELLRESAQWMRWRGWDAWPEDGFPDERLLPGLVEGTVWLLVEQGRPVGTVAADDHPDRELVALPEIASRVPGSWIVHRMAVAVDRRGRGLGGLMLDAVTDLAARSERCEVLLNCNRRAVPLQNAYRAWGFSHEGTVDAGRKSGWLASRPARLVPGLSRRVTVEETTCSWIV